MNSFDTLNAESPSPKDFPSSEGVLAVLAAATLWGAAFFFRKIVLGEISPLLLSFLTLLIAGTSILALLRTSLSLLLRTFLQGPLLLILLGFFQAIALTAMYDALEHSSLAIAVLLERVQPIIALLFAWLFLREYVSRNKALYVVLAILSSALLAVKSPQDLVLTGIGLRGIVGVLIAATSWAACTIIGRALMRRGNVRSLEVTILRLLIAAFFLFPAVLIRGEMAEAPSLSMTVWLIAFGCGSVCTAGGYLLYMHGLKTVNGALAGILEFTMPVTSVLLGVLFLGESLTFTQGIAAITIGFSLWRVTVQ